MVPGSRNENLQQRCMHQPVKRHGIFRSWLMKAQFYDRNDSKEQFHSSLDSASFRVHMYEITACRPLQDILLDHGYWHGTVLVQGVSCCRYLIELHSALRTVYNATHLTVRVNAWDGSDVSLCRRSET